MALKIQTRFVESVTAKLPWLPHKAVMPLSVAFVFVPISVLAFSYGPMASVEPETSTLSGGTTAIADPSASGGQSIRFGAPSTAICTTKPDASNTGASGTLTTDNRTTLNIDGEVIENKQFPASIQIRADNITLRNVTVAGGIDIGDELDNILLDRVDATSAGITSSSNVTIEYSHFTAFNGDALYISGWNGVNTTNLTVRYSFIDRPSFTSTEAHWDGIQMRGVDNVTIFCNNFDVGEWQFEYNVLIYSEPAFNGNYNIIIDNNWLNGANFAIMGGTSDPIGYEITNNKILSADFYYGLCYPGGGLTAENIDQVIQTGNTLDGAPLAQVCSASDF